jgi:hypothetical protein
VLERCLRKDPRNRLHDIRDVLIELDDDAGITTSSATSAAGSRPTLRTREGLAWILVALMAAGLTAVVLRSHRTGQASSSDLIEFTIQPPAAYSGTQSEEVTFAVSPNGRHIAFVANGMLWVRSLDNPEPRMLLGTERAYSPFWRPDSLAIGFSRRIN